MYIFRNQNRLQKKIEKSKLYKKYKNGMLDFTYRKKKLKK